MSLVCRRVVSNGLVWTVGINRPGRRNAVDRPTAAELKRIFVEFDKDDTASVAVLHGHGGNFCAGADLQAIASGDPALRNNTDELGPMGPTGLLLRKPVIAAIEGFAVAGGLELAVWCDLRVAARSSTLGVFCRRFGVPLIDGGTVRLPRLIGQSRAADLILTGRGVSASEAADMGLVNRVVEDGSALDSAVALAEQIAAHPQECMRNDRMSMITQWGCSGGLEGALREELFVHGKRSMDALAPGQAAARFTAQRGSTKR